MTEEHLTYEKQLRLEHIKRHITEISRSELEDLYLETLSLLVQLTEKVNTAFKKNGII